MINKSVGSDLEKFLKQGSIVPNHILKKFKEQEKKAYARTGPELLWMKELEDDSKLTLPEDDLSTGNPTWTRMLNDFISGVAVLGGQPNAGKALVDDTLITVVEPSNIEGLSDKASLKKICEIEVGDWVIGSQGLPIKVLGVYPQGVKKCVNFQLDNGCITIGSSLDHLWFTTTEGVGSVKTTLDIVNTLLDKNHLFPYLQHNIYFPYEEWNLKSKLLELEGISTPYDASCTCIKVDAADGLFLTASGVLTHNTTCIVQFINDILELNDDTIVIDLSLDDPVWKRHTQLICNRSGLHYQVVGNPIGMSEMQLDKYEEARDELYEYVKEQRYFFFSPGEEFNIEGKIFRDEFYTYRALNNMIASFRKTYPDKKIVIFVDAYNDLSAEADDVAKFDKILNELKSIANHYEVKLFMSAHLRKVDNRKGTLSLDDIKGSKSMEFAAMFMGLLYNDKKEHPLDNPSMLERNKQKMPVIAVQPHKNKASGWDKTWFGILDNRACRVLPITRQEYNTCMDDYVQRRKNKKGE